MKEYKVQAIDLMQYINTKYNEPFIHELIEFDGALDAKKLISALDRFMEVFPLLKCRYDSARNVFVEQETLVGNDLVTVDDTAEKADLLTESLDTNEKLIKFTLSKNLLVITVSHLVCDGIGFKNLIYLLCELYDGKDAKEQSVLMNREFSSVASGVKSNPLSLLKMLFSMIGGYKNKPVYGKIEPEQKGVYERAIAAETMAKVHTAAKAQGATLNDVFLTAYARAIEKLCSTRKINLPCMVNLRKYTTKETGIANLSGTYNLNVKLKKNETFAQSLTKVSRAMNKQKKTKNDILGPMLLESKYEKLLLDKFLKLYGGMQTGAYTDFTNLGKLDEEKLSFGGAKVVNAIGYSGLHKAPHFQLTVSSFKGATTFSSIVFCGESERQKISVLMDAIQSEIEKFGKSS